MKILEVKSLLLPEVKLIKYQRFLDERGYFTESFRLQDLLKFPQSFPLETQFVQANESYSKANVIRGLHFQWDQVMGKLVRCLSGRLLDIAVDIRLGSPNFGKAIICELQANREADFDQYVWLPPGFAHGVAFAENTVIEYLCTSVYSPGNEAGIYPLASDIDWSLCDKNLKQQFDGIAAASLLSDKDKKGFSLTQWAQQANAQKFIYAKN